MESFDSFFKKSEQQTSEEHSFVAENGLEYLLQKASSDKNFVEEFYNCLLSSEIYVLVSDEYNGNESLPILKFNEKHVPIFSSVARIMDNDYLRKNGVQYVKMDAKAFLQSMADSYVLLNPFSKYAKEFTPAEVKRLLYGKAAQHTFATIPQGTKISIGVPAYYPKELAEALTKMFSAEPGIKKAFILFYQAGKRSAQFLIVVDYSGDLSEVVSKNNAPLKAVLPAGALVDFATIEQLDLDKSLENVEPFYVR